MKILKKFENHLNCIESEMKQDSVHIKKSIEIFKESIDVIFINTLDRLSENHSKNRH